MDDTRSDPAPASPTPPPRRRSRAARAGLALGVLLLSLVLLLALLVAGGWQALRTEAGTAWLLSKVSGLRITAGRGSLTGGPFSADRVDFALEGVPVAVRIDGLAWRDLGWHWRPYPGAWTGLRIDGLSAQRVEIRSRPTPGQPPGTPPQRLRLPLELHVPDARVQTLRIDDHPPLQDLRFALHLGTDGGTLHRVENLGFTWDRVRVSGRGTLGADTPLPVSLELRAQSTPLPGATGPWATAWQAELGANGPLARMAVRARLGAAAAQDRPPAALDATATVQPWQAWPLSDLRARLEQFDLAALLPGAPQTRLSGRAEIAASGLDRPARVDLQLANALPGRWDERKLPVHALRVDLAATPSAPSQVALRAFDLRLGTQERSAGRWRGEGRWNDGELVLDSRVEDLRPALLDARAPDIRVAGPVQGRFRSSVGGWTSSARLRLEGGLPDGPPMTLRTDLELESDREGLHGSLQDLQVQSGAARASGSARGRWRGGAGWQLASRGELQQFDPSAWWPGEAGGAWRRGGHRLNGRWDLDLAGTAAPPGDWPWPGWRGRAELSLQDSVLMRVPLQGTMRWRAGGTAEGALQLDATAGGNRLALSGVRAPGTEDRWQAELDAPALPAVAPLLALAPSLQPWAPTGGRIVLRTQASGRWPQLRWQGEAQASDLRSPRLTLAGATARWRFAPSPDAPLEVVLRADSLAMGPQRIDRLQADLTGTTASHRLQLQADTGLRPPAWTDVLLGAAAGRGTAVRLVASGQWRAVGDGGRWQGELQQLRAGGGQAEGGWLQADGLRGELGFGPGAALRQVQVQPGRLRVLGAALRWDELRWQSSADGAPPRLDLRAELEPLRVAPLLATLQPDFGWGGDLVVQGRATIRSAGAFAADVVLERVGGDLSVTDEGGTQSLGLTDLRLGLVANQGTWFFTQALAGTNVGVLGGAQSLRVPATTVWPSPDTPMEGVAELRVDNLGVWGPWTPPGWRLSGRLHSSVTLGGRFGAPEYTGRLEGSGLGVRNLLQGVNVTDGEVRIALKGPTAHIERFELRGGTGILRLEGGASFGESPRAQLRLNAGRFQVLGRVDRRIVASGQAQLQLEADDVRLDGRFIVDEGLVDFSRADAPTLDEDVTVVRRIDGRRVTTSADQPAPEPAAPAAAPATPRTVRATVDVDLGEQLHLRGRGLDAFLRGRLQLTTPNNRLAVSGTVRTENGTYAAYGQRLVIERGLVTFLGPVENPRLDIIALRPNLDVRVGVAVGGTALKPRVRLFSEPEMTDADKLSWLVLGRAPEGLGGADTALLQRAAMALLSGEGEGTDKVLQAFGIDEFSVRQEGEGDVRNTVVALGKQLSRRWYLGYERGLSSTTGTWQLIYRLAQRFTLRGQAGEDNGVDLIWSWRW